MANNVIVIGAQWGDEGKGKIIDFLSPNVKGVVRFQGGHNAGHTLTIGDQKIILKIIPSGIFHDVVCFIGNGVVLSPEILLREIDDVEKLGADVKSRLKISDNCCLLLPYHVARDLAQEKALAKNMIGTTGRGIGPAYEDKVARRAIKAGDLLHPKRLANRLEALADYHNFILKNYYHAEIISWQKVYEDLLVVAEKIIPFLVDVTDLLDQYKSQGKKLLFEGAQGTCLDVDHGTYPFVTSSNTTVGCAATGSGFGLLSFDYVLGIVKAYTTRVGSGPFPTELNDATGQKIRERGHEFGSVTGRPRRCGWFDAVLMRRAKQINSFSALGLMKIDVLDGLEKIYVCNSYLYKGKKIFVPPNNVEDFEMCEPIYEELSGWRESTSGIRKLEELPKSARDYISYLEAVTSTPITIVSTSPKRDDTIVLKNPFA